MFPIGISYSIGYIYPLIYGTLTLPMKFDLFICFSITLVTDVVYGGGANAYSSSLFR